MLYAWRGIPSRRKVRHDGLALRNAEVISALDILQEFLPGLTSEHSGVVRKRIDLRQLFDGSLPAFQQHGVGFGPTRVLAELPQALQQRLPGTREEIDHRTTIDLFVIWLLHGLQQIHQFGVGIRMAGDENRAQADLALQVACQMQQPRLGQFLKMAVGGRGIALDHMALRWRAVIPAVCEVVDAGLDCMAQFRVEVLLCAVRHFNRVRRGLYGIVGRPVAKMFWTQ